MDKISPGSLTAQFWLGVVLGLLDVLPCVLELVAQLAIVCWAQAALVPPAYSASLVPRWVRWGAGQDCRRYPLCPKVGLFSPKAT